MMMLLVLDMGSLRVAALDLSPRRV